MGAKKYGDKAYLERDVYLDVREECWDIYNYLDFLGEKEPHKKMFFNALQLQVSNLLNNLEKVEKF